MKHSIAATLRPDGDKYSLAAYASPRTRLDLEQLLWGAMRAGRAGLSIVEIVTQVPQIVDADLEAFYVARAHAVARATAPRHCSGRPERNDYLVAEVAYMVDLERRPRKLSELIVGANFDVLSYTAPHVTTRSPHVDLRGVERNGRRWLRAGRKVLHDVGAWPWAVVPAGLLPEKWWLDTIFQDTLYAWQAGQTPASRAA
jgi:hypothetical protein